jgi:glycosyltransferase involved in cell wall biosynthesis
VPTEAVKRDVHNLLGPKVAAKTHVVYEGVRFSPTSPTEIASRQQTVLYVGTIEPRKNVDIVCRAFRAAQLRNSDLKNWRLVLVGKRGWLTESQAKELDLAIAAAGAVELGYQSNEDVQSLLGASSIFCYVSEAEGFGLPPLEAMALGTPVIVSDDAALSEVVGVAGRIVSRGPGMETELCEAFMDVSGNESLRVSMQALGLARSELFSWASAAESTIAVATVMQDPDAR